jgi:hypothetical protein
MLHSQLKIKYPGCPFLINDTNINKSITNKTPININNSFMNNSSIDETSNQFVFDEDTLTSTDFLKLISDKLIFSERSNVINDFLSWYEKKNETDKEIEDYISSDVNGVNVGTDVKVVWTRLKQPLKSLDIGSKGNLCINFHACAYNDEHGTFLNKEFEGDIGWIVIPICPSETDAIIPDVNINKSHDLIIHPSDRSIKINETYIDQSKVPSRGTDGKIEEPKLLNPATYKTDIDNRYEKFEAGIRSSRVSARKFIVRDNNQIKIKHDVTSNLVNEVKLMSLQNDLNRQMEYRSYVGKIPLTDITRSNASLIRDRLDNPYKAYRFRNNPELYKQHKKIDPHIREISDHVVRTHNFNQRSLDTSITLNVDTQCDNFDFILDKVGVKKLNGLYKFSPVSTGRIFISNRHLLDYLSFVTVMRYKQRIHITLHEIS